MSILAIKKYPDPILLKPASKVKEVTEEIVKLMDDMVETMYAEKGVGLAAPQVGISKRVIVINIGGENNRLLKMVNPEVISSEGEIFWEEGCLSIPLFRIKVKRKAKIVVKGLDKRGSEIEFLADGLLAVAFQHEIDHLNGRLLIDMVSKAERKKYLENCGKL